MIVYVITPSLNKSFKFQSDWPNNNSQSYLLTSVAKDLKDDSAYKFTQKDNNYIFTTKTNYPNNPKYVKQNIVLDKKFDLKKVEVKDEQDITYIEFTVKSLDKKANFSENEFSLEEITKDFEVQEDSKENENTQSNKSNETTQDTKTNQNDKLQQNSSNNKQDNNISTESEEQNNSNETSNNNNQSNETTTNETSKVDENVFPLYLPSNTSLSDKEVIETSTGERVIMTFSGDNPFILVQETVKPAKELEIIPTYGEPFMLIDTVGSLTETSYTWTSNGIEYYIVSDQMDKTELLEVAKSINIISTINEK